MKQASGQHPQTTGQGTGKLHRWLPAVVLLLLIGAGYAAGLHRHLSLTALAENRDMLRLWVDGNLGLALAAFMLLYVAIVALSIPVAGIMSIAGGFLFGWVISAPATVVAAVTGAAAVFQIVKTSFGAALAERAGPLVQRLSRGFAENAFSLLLFLRLTPVFPFWAVNAVAGLCRIPLRTFIAATALGIIPASVAFALVGAGLDRVIDTQLATHKACVASQGPENCSFSIEASSLLTPELWLGLTALGIVALIPVGIRLWKERTK
jgi:uncharacterized membrane protein YdjX (TVP38/TMEM64 family)